MLDHGGIRFTRPTQHEYAITGREVESANKYLLNSSSTSDMPAGWLKIIGISCSV